MSKVSNTINVGFWENQLCERGTTVAVYDYAYFNKTILNNNSFIFYDKNNKENNENIIKKFKKEFEVFGVDNFEEADEIIKNKNITHLYTIKGGQKDDKVSKYAKNCIHCVFNATEPHGDVYSCISSVVAGYKKEFPIVPHIINLPKHDENMRKELKIPKEAIVFAGYGGRGSFDIKFVHKVVYDVAQKNPNIYFLFANFMKFCPDLSNIIHLPTITDMREKVRFINTSNAMLWGRRQGETFGIAIGEFSSLNKPVVAIKTGDLSHYNILQNKGVWYSDPYSLHTILTTYNKERVRERDWNAYRDYEPEKVIKIFEKTYLS